ncbi:hypothetical protein ME805_00930 [Lactobacillus delbrueckii]|nr:hypothetical protein ME801_12560 [Lactobacillus delbrueckii]GHN54144.1 hypothetical protein ME803_00930 [Lactobacillus delbrueckii]GHN57869.1 hypothetical protein ME805_00930 [Lactobacillus delbrueckii]
MPKVELNLEDDESKELLLGDRDKAMQSIMAKILDEILKLLQLAGSQGRPGPLCPGFFR